MTCVSDIVSFLKDQGRGIVDFGQTVDRVTHHCEEKPLVKVAVTWMATTRVIHQAGKAGCQLMVVHEPIIWNHHDRDEECFDSREGLKKRELLNHYGLTVVRCHDAWDYQKDIGILPSWANTLEIRNYTIEKYSTGHLFMMCDLEEGTTLGTLATHIARLSQPLGQQLVPVVGDPDMPIRRLALNAGAGMTNPKLHVEARDRFGAQGATTGELIWWQLASWALDAGYGLIHVNHGVTESPGMASLYELLKATFEDLEFMFIQETAPYCMFGPDGPVANPTGFQP